MALEIFKKKSKFNNFDNTLEVIGGSCVFFENLIHQVAS